jgi:hypothetical protein
MQATSPGLHPASSLSIAAEDDARALFLSQLREATADARTWEGHRLVMTHEQRGGMLVTSYRAIGRGGAVVDAYESVTAFWPGEVDPARMAAFLGAVRSVVSAFDRSWATSGKFLPLALLEVHSLVTTEDFARAILDDESGVAAEAEIFAEDLVHLRGLPKPSPDLAIVLFRLDAATGKESELNALADRVGRDDALTGYAFALLELWSQRGFYTDDKGVSLRVAERLYWTLERRSTPVARMRLAELKERLEAEGVFGTGAAAFGRGGFA